MAEPRLFVGKFCWNLEKADVGALSKKQGYVFGILPGRAAQSGALVEHVWQAPDARFQNHKRARPATLK